MHVPQHEGDREIDGDCELDGFLSQFLMATEQVTGDENLVRSWDLGGVWWTCADDR